MSDQATDQATEAYGADTAVAWGRSQVESAPIALRALAYVADLCLVAAVVAIALIIDVTAGLEKGLIFFGIGAAVAVVASIVLHGRYGASPGKMLAGLAVVDSESNRAVALPAAGIRTVVFTVLAPLVYLPAWSVLADSRRRGIHDKASRTTVVDSADVTDAPSSSRTTTAVAVAGAGSAAALGGLAGETGNDPGLQRIPTPLPGTPLSEQDESADPAEYRERLQPPALPPLPEDVPGLRPIPPRFGPPPEDGTASAEPLGPEPAYNFPPAQPPIPPRPQGGPIAQPPVGAPAQPPVAPAAQPSGPRPVPGTPAAAVPIVLRFDDGHSIDVRSDGIIGREPVIPGNLDSSKVAKHVLVDDTASVSKTHLLFGIIRGELWVEDVGSTNGSAIAFQDSWTELTKGVKYAVERGSVVHIGQRSFKVFGG